jgi:hypothetical protein
LHIDGDEDVGIAVVMHKTNVVLTTSGKTLAP